MIEHSEHFKDSTILIHIHLHYDTGFLQTIFVMDKTVGFISLALKETIVHYAMNKNHDCGCDW